jgi:hypothetical protein
VKKWYAKLDNLNELQIFMNNSRTLDFGGSTIKQRSTVWKHKATVQHGYRPVMDTQDAKGDLMKNQSNHRRTSTLLNPIKPPLWLERSLMTVVLVAALLSSIAFTAVAASAATTTLYVNSGPITGSGDTSCSTAAYSKIQSAVTAASSGDTVVVCAGSYIPPSGGIDLTQPITVAASGSVTLSGAGPIFTLYNTTSPSTGVTNVTIEGFDFKNVTGSGYNGVITVGGYGAGDVTIQNNTFSNITDEAIGYHGNPGLSGALGTNWKILNNTITNVTGNSTARDGMFLGDLSGSTIAGNSISYTSWAGIILNGEPSATLPAPEHNNVVENNTVSNVPEEGIQIAFGTKDIVSNNNVSNAGNGGTPVSGRNCAICLYNANQTEISVTGNALTDSYQGVGVGQANSTLTSLGSGITVTGNSFVGDTNAGVVNNATSGTLQATNNWWGSPLGPTTSAGSGPGRAGALVSTNVNFTPWCRNANCVAQGPQGRPQGPPAGRPRA